MRSARHALRIACAAIALLLAVTSVRLGASALVSARRAQGDEREEDPETESATSTLEFKGEFARVRHRIHPHPPGPSSHPLEFAFAEPAPFASRPHVPSPVKTSPRRQT